tara:strand:+ start:145 stop:435 length:291 start_codon:yes stop_codon:yes gene_type:complete
MFGFVLCEHTSCGSKRHRKPARNWALRAFLIVYRFQFEIDRLKLYFLRLIEDGKVLRKIIRIQRASATLLGGIILIVEYFVWALPSLTQRMWNGHI